MTLHAQWIDGWREPRVPFDRKYAHGIDVDLSGGGRACSAALSYPAPRCGQYVVTCDECGRRVIVTAAGRVDDPRSVKVACAPRPRS